MRLRKKLLFVFIPLSTLSIMLSSCSNSNQTNYDNNNLTQYNYTQESLNEICSKIKSEDFLTDFNIKVEDVKPSDIVYKHRNFYKDFTVYILIDSQKRGLTDLGLGIKKENCVTFKIYVEDKKNNFSYYSKNKTFFLFSYK